MSNILSLVILIVVSVACGKNSGDSSKIPSDFIMEQAPAPDGSNIDGLYMAKFQTMNSAVNGDVPGSATIQRNKDKIFAYVRIFGGAAKVWHQQFVATGSRCPTASDDLNKDGFIDIVEGNKVWGEILIPMDSDIGSQYSGKNIYPVSDEAGTYFYERVTNFNKFFNDLKVQDKNLNDNVTKLPEGQGLNLEGRVAVVLGVDENANFPLTVETIGKQRAHQTLPVTCGIFKKITTLPGVPDDGVIPGPVAPVDPNGDVPAEGGIEIPPIEPGIQDVGPLPVPPTPGDSDEGDNDDWVDRIGSWWRDRWREMGAGAPMTFANENNEIIPVD